MMIDPYSYLLFINKLSTKEVEKEKEDLLNYNQRYKSHTLNLQEYNTKPSPDVIYSYNKDYLKVINQLLKERSILDYNTYSSITSIKVINNHINPHNLSEMIRYITIIKKDGSCIQKSYYGEKLNIITIHCDVKEIENLLIKTEEILRKPCNPETLIDDCSHKTTVHFSKQAIILEDDEREIEIEHLVKDFIKSIEKD